MPCLEEAMLRVSTFRGATALARLPRGVAAQQFSAAKNPATGSAAKAESAPKGDDAAKGAKPKGGVGLLGWSARLFGYTAVVGAGVVAAMELSSSFKKQVRRDWRLDLSHGVAKCSERGDLLTLGGGNAARASFRHALPRSPAFTTATVESTKSLDDVRPRANVSRLIYRRR